MFLHKLAFELRTRDSAALRIRNSEQSTHRTMATERRAILETVGPSHYVVHFDEDDCIARIPRKSMVRPSMPSVGDTCSVKWSDGVEYTATVLAMGKSLFCR